MALSSVLSWEMDCVWLDTGPLDGAGATFGFAMEARKQARASEAGTPAGLWLLDELTGVFIDKSGGGKSNDGTMTAGTGRGTAKIVPNIEACVDFDGADDRITVSDQSAIQDVFAGGGGTFYAWQEIDSDGGSNEGRVASKGGVWEIRTVDESGGKCRLSSSTPSRGRTASGGRTAKSSSASQGTSSSSTKRPT